MRVFIAVCTSLVMTGCASIIKGTRGDVFIDTMPAGRPVSVTDLDGVEVYRGDTPTTLRLKTGDSYFTPAAYVVRLTGVPGATPAELEAHVSAWYFGNLIFGGLIGLLIVDPLTGAMYSLPDRLTVGANGIVEGSGEGPSMRRFPALRR